MLHNVALTKHLSVCTVQFPTAAAFILHRDPISGACRCNHNVFTMCRYFTYFCLILIICRVVLYYGNMGCSPGPRTLGPPPPPPPSQFPFAFYTGLPTVPYNMESPYLQSHNLNCERSRSRKTLRPTESSAAYQSKDLIIVRKHNIQLENLSKLPFYYL